MCGTFTDLGRFAIGGKDLEVTMVKFKGLFAEKIDVSEDPNNAMLGFNVGSGSGKRFCVGSVHVVCMLLPFVHGSACVVHILCMFVHILYA